MGRPSKENKRDHQLNLSLTKDEYVDAYWLAHRSGMRLVDYGRWRLLGNPGQPAAPPQAASTSDHLLFAQLKRIGNNLNQLVRVCHATRSPPPPALSELLDTIREIINRSGAR